MSNGLPRTEKYRNLSAEEHLRQLDNELDALEVAREQLLTHLDEAATKRYEDMNKKLNWVLTTFVSLILLVCGTLLAVVVKT